MEELIQLLQEHNILFKLDEPLKPYTTWKVGGPAKLFIDIKNKEDAITVIKYVNEYSIEHYFLGSGSNILISDEGYNGVVIKNSITGIEVGEKEIEIENTEISNDVRLIQAESDKYYDFSQLDYDESNLSKVRASVYSGTLLSFTINSLINKGLTGLQWFAGIPGTVGGAVFNNIHGGSHFFSEYVDSVDLINKNGEIVNIKAGELGFGYDKSKLQNQNMFILKVYFNLYKGDKNKAQLTAFNWARAKSEKQPYNSAGCCFKNISKPELDRLGFKSNSWGYIIEHELGLKGFKIGGAQISNKHAAFIENTGNASSNDIMNLLELIYNRSKEKLNITPCSEIFFLGFDKARIEKFL